MNVFSVEINEFFFGLAETKITGLALGSCSGCTCARAPAVTWDVSDGTTQSSHTNSLSDVSDTPTQYPTLCPISCRTYSLLAKVNSE